MSAYNAPSADTLSALETAPSMFLVLSPDLYILTASDLYLQATRNRRELIVGKHIFKAFPDNPDLPDADGVKNINASLQEVLRTRKAHRMRFQRYDVPDINATGKFITRYWDPSHTPVLDKDGNISYIVQLATDVTDQVILRRQLTESIDAQAASVVKFDALNSKLDLAEQELLSMNFNLEKEVDQRTAELKESEENLQAAFDAGDLGSCSLDLKTGRAEMSPRYRSLYGLPLVGEITWEMVTAAVEPEFLDEVNLAMFNAMHSGLPVNSTYAIRHLRTGERRWMRVIGKVRKDEEGVFSNIYAVVMDVTVWKEEELRKNDFIAMVSHELKTPLTSIAGYAQVLGRRFKKDEDLVTGGLLKKMERQLKKMAVMIESFLNISSLEAGKIRLTLRRGKLSELITEIAEDFSATIDSHEIIFSTIPEVSIKADFDKLGQVIHNLVSNAVKYSPLGTKISIVCSLGENQLTVAVKDSGIGISRENLSKVFQKFYRVGGVYCDMVSGFGIGLFLAAEIIDLHGGKMGVESELGGGSTFYFTLPML